MNFVPIPVGPNFKVKVTTNDGPVKGLKLNSTGPGGFSRSSITDADGIATFTDVPPGTQYLKADHDMGYGKALEVKSDRKNIIVPMHWPSIEPIHVHSFRDHTCPGCTPVGT